MLDAHNKSLKENAIETLTHFCLLLLIYNPRKQKTFRLSDVFRGYRQATPGCDRLRLVKDYLIRCNRYLNVSITKLLLKYVKDSYDKYNIELEEQRKLELKLKAEQNKIKEIVAKEAEDA